MPKLLSDADYHRVITYKNDLNMTNVKIAEELQIRRQTVAQIIKRNEQTGSPLVKIKGFKKKTNIATSEEQDANIEELTRRSPFTTPRMLKSKLKLNCSLATIKRRLRKVHLHGRKPVCKTYLTDIGKRKRLLWCKKHKKFDWKKVMFSDEVLIQTSKHGMQVVRRPPGTRYEEKFTKEVNRSGRVKVMVWGGITYEGLTDLVFINGNLNRHNYLQQVLEKKVKPILQRNPDMIYQQDGAAPHRALIVQDWFRENNFNKLEWPAYSPDFNIIENLWAILKEEVGPLNHLGANQQGQLIRKIKVAWQKVKNGRGEMIRKLYNSMPRRLLRCIEKKGGITKY